MTANHFDKIADVYNNVWHFSDQYKEWMLSHITSRLKLDKEDYFIDIGGGTGTFTKLVSAYAELSKTPLCVEPSREMCAKAEECGGVRIMCEDANEFVNRNMQYDKVLIKEAIHHVKDRGHLWSGLFTHLSVGGRILIVTRPQNIPMPLFKAAKEAFHRNQPPYDIFVDELKSKGFSVESNTDTYRFFLDKEIWYSMIRSRFMSDLAEFSDDEIESGIQEIDADFQSETMGIDDTIVFISASKF